MTRESSAIMPIEILIGTDVKVKCATVSEAAQLLRAIRAEKAGPETRSARPNGAFSTDSTDDDLRSMLRHVREAGSAGIQADALARALGIPGAKGLGSRIMRLRKALHAAGVSDKDIVSTKRRGRAGMYWYPGTKINDAERVLQGGG